jgi:hypothetical protein
MKSTLRFPLSCGRQAGKASLLWNSSSDLLLKGKNPPYRVDCSTPLFIPSAQAILAKDSPVGQISYYICLPIEPAGSRQPPVESKIAFLHRTSFSDMSWRKASAGSERASEHVEVIPPDFPFNRPLYASYIILIGKLLMDEGAVGGEVDEDALKPLFPKSKRILLIHPPR